MKCNFDNKKAADMSPNCPAALTQIIMKGEQSLPIMNISNISKEKYMMDRNLSDNSGNVNNLIIVEKKGNDFLLYGSCNFTYEGYYNHVK